VLGHFTKLTSETDQNAPTGDSYSSKVGGELLWREPKGRLFASYEVRHQGERADIELPENPVGDVIPAFTVQNVRAGVRLPMIGRTAAALTVAVLNLTDELYAEASNTSFFRPEPRRSAQVAVRLDF
jgi:outer membrane receptor protein involved in Fe transport